MSQPVKQGPPSSESMAALRRTLIQQQKQKQRHQTRSIDPCRGLPAPATPTSKSTLDQDTVAFDSSIGISSACPPDTADVAECQAPYTLPLQEQTNLFKVWLLPIMS